MIGGKTKMKDKEVDYKELSEVDQNRESNEPELDEEICRNR